MRHTADKEYSNNPKRSSIAIFHNFMDNIGGAELLSLTLARELNADFYSTNIDQEKINKLGFSQVRLISIGKVPINAPLRQQIALWRFSRLNLRGKYDQYIISGDWAISAAVYNRPALCYVHSPIREIWDLYEYTKVNNVPKLAWPLFNLWVKYNRRVCRKYIKNIDIIVCNSINTNNRIKKYFNRDTPVINPPIETEKFYYRQNGDFWLSVNRLITHKRVEMQLKAFALMPREKLVIVGCYEQSMHFRKYVNYIKKLKPKNVELLSWVNQTELIDLYANCRGFIVTAKDEDFGMSAVEAMAAGKPVIAPNEGGFKETIIDGVTGKLIDDIDEHKIVRAVKELSLEPQKYKEDCINQAKKFDTKIFMEKIREMINKSS